jgi:argininosuccinate synthase
MRKTLAVASHLDKLVSDWKELAELRHKTSMDIYNVQDEDTKEVLDRIVDRLRLAATGYVTLRLPGGAVKSVRVESEYVGYALLFIATEILKDLAIYGVQIANFDYHPSICAECGAKVV